jgi:hypothetical protein
MASSKQGTTQSIEQRDKRKRKMKKKQGTKREKMELNAEGRDTSASDEITRLKDKNA